MFNDEFDSRQVGDDYEGQSTVDSNRDMESTDSESSSDGFSEIGDNVESEPSSDRFNEIGDNLDGKEGIE